MEDLTPRVAVITGASSGIGLAAAHELARRGWVVALIGRDPDRLTAAAARVREQASAPVAAYRCDFAELAQVREVAATLAANYPHIDLLANNAGGAYPHRQTTVDGFEATIQTNYLAPFLLTHVLRDRLRGGRIVNTASAVHRLGVLDPTDPWLDRGRYRMFARYGSAKLANILFTAEAARRWTDIVSTAFHPGVVRTRFGNDKRLIAAFYRVAPLIRTPARGARTLVWLANAAPGDLRSGGYYHDERLRQPARTADDPHLAARLWEASAAVLRRRDEPTRR